MASRGIAMNLRRIEAFVAAFEAGTSGASAAGLVVGAGGVATGRCAGGEVACVVTADPRLAAKPVVAQAALAHGSGVGITSSVARRRDIDDRLARRARQPPGRVASIGGKR